MQSTPMIAILPLGFLVLVAVVVFIVAAIVAAIMSGRNRGALGVLGALLGFGAVALAGVLLLFGLRVSQSVDLQSAQIEPPREVPPAPASVAPRTVPSTYGGPPRLVPDAPAAPEPHDPPDPPADPSDPPEPGQTILVEQPAPTRNADEPIKAEAEAGVVRSPLPRPRPGWIDEPQGKQADGTYRKIATVELYRSRAECDEALPTELRKAVKEFIDQYLETAGAAESVALDMPYIRDRLVKSQWEEHTSDNYGPVVNLHNLLVFDGRVNADIKDRYQQAQVAGRLATTGLGAGLLLGLLGTVFGYLKFDTLTRGYYARRLQCAAGAMILAEAAIGALWAHGKIGF